MYRITYTANTPQIKEMHNTQREVQFSTNTVFEILKRWRNNKHMLNVVLEEWKNGKWQKVNI